MVIVLNNRGYGTERLLHPGDYKFNDIHSWQYHRLPEVLQGGTGYEIRTEGEFHEALNSAWADTTGPSLLHVHLSQSDASRALEHMAEMMARTVVQK